MSPLSSYVELIKQKIKDQLPTLETNLRKALYPTLDQTQKASGALDALQAVHDSMDKIIEKFHLQYPGSSASIETFWPYLKNEIEIKSKEVSYLSNQNTGFQQGLIGIADSLETLATNHLEALNNTRPSITADSPSSVNNDDLNADPSESTAGEESLAETLVDDVAEAVVGEVL